MLVGFHVTFDSCLVIGKCTYRLTTIAHIYRIPDIYQIIISPGRTKPSIWGPPYPTNLMKENKPFTSTNNGTSAMKNK